MTDSPLLVTERDNVLEVVLNRPAKHNAINLEMIEGLYAAVELFGSKRDLRVMLLRANGRFFSAGADVHGGLFPNLSERSPSAYRKRYRSRPTSLHPLNDELEAIEKPVVVAHQGPCLGGALEISLSCDFRLAVEEAHYGFPEIGYGGLPGSGGMSRLTRTVGPHWARWLIMTNTNMGARQALAVGLLHEIYPSEEFEARCWEFCQNLVRQPAEALAAAKVAIELVADLERGQARNVERLATSTLVFGDEYQKGLAQKRERLAQKKKE